MSAAEEDITYSKLPIEERCVHKVIFYFNCIIYIIGLLIFLVYNNY